MTIFKRSFDLLIAFSFSCAILAGLVHAQDAAPAAQPLVSGPLKWVLDLFGGSIVPPIAVGLAAWVCKHIVMLFQEAKGWFRAHTSAKVADTMDGMLDTAQGIACSLVNEAEGTYVEQMKKEGQWSNPDVQKKALEGVRDDLTMHIKALLPQLAAQAGTGLEALTTTLIEHEVAKLASPVVDSSKQSTVPAAPAK